MPPENNPRNSGTIESLISYSGESEPEHVEFNLALFEALNARYASKRIVAAPRTHDTSYTTGIGEKRASTLERKIGLRGLRVLELGCGDGMLSRVLTKDYGCEVVGVDIQAYDAWTQPAQGNLTHLVHDVTSADNSLLGTFDRVVSFAVMEHVVHPHAALQAVYAMLKPGGKAYIYANLYRGAKASHRYREVFFPWPHLLFEASVWRAFYGRLLGEEKQAAWVNKLTYDQYIATVGRIGFNLVEHFPSAPFFDEDFYREFEYQLAAYPKFDLMHDFVHLILEKPNLNSSLSKTGSAADRSSGQNGIPDFDQFRRALAAREFRQYEKISYWPQTPSAETVAKAMNNQPFNVFGFTFQFGRADSWRDDDSPRSRQLFLQAWNHLDPLIQYQSEREDIELLGFLCGQAEEWIAQLRDSDFLVNEGSKPAEDDFLAADTAVGNRFHRLAYLVDAAARSPAITIDQFAVLSDMLLAHMAWLVRDSNYFNHTNRGILQSLALICGASRLASINLPETSIPKSASEAVMTGVGRLSDALRQMMTSDGLLMEHSSMYHLAVASSLRASGAAELLVDQEGRGAADSALAAGTWFYDASGRIANFGDSDLEPDYPFARQFQRKGEVGIHRMATFTDGGYWFVKGGGKKDAYIAQTCAFHSRTHKQADSGAFIWRDRGKDILIDSGRYGYVGRTDPGSEAFRNGFWYSDQRRQYVESSRAHNTVGIDGKDHPRFRSKPFGSGIIASSQKDGVYACESSIKNLQRATHSRVLAVKPGKWLLCLDTIRMRDGDAHDIQQHFHVNPAWGLEERDVGSLVFRGPSGLTLHATTVFGDNPITDFARGRGNPEVDEPEHLFGWWSPRHMQIEPCNSFTVSTRGDYVSVASLFTFEPVQIDRAYSGFNASRRRYRFRWSGAAGAETFSFERSTDDGTSTLAIL